MFEKNKKSKYYSKRVLIDGHSFDSKLEGDYYLYLKSYFIPFDMQPKIYLTSAKILYKPDFFIKIDDSYYVDVKGSPRMETASFKIKKRLWQEYGPAPLALVMRERGEWKTYETITPGHDKVGDSGDDQGKGA